MTPIGFQIQQVVRQVHGRGARRERKEAHQRVKQPHRRNVVRQKRRQEDQQILGPLVRTQCPQQILPALRVHRHQLRGHAERVDAPLEQGAGGYGKGCRRLPPNGQIGRRISQVSKRLKSVLPAISLNRPQLIRPFQIRFTVGRQHRVEQPKIVRHALGDRSIARRG